MSSSPPSRPRPRQSAASSLLSGIAPYVFCLLTYSLGMYHGSVEVNSRALTIVPNQEASSNNCNVAVTSSETVSRSSVVTSKNKKDDDGWKTIEVFYGKLQQPAPPNKRSMGGWYSQARQDEVVFRMLGNKRDGYFVDLAANDAVRISNTYALESRHGWNGLCIEPNPQYYFDHTRFRKCQLVAAIVGEERMEEIKFNYRGVFGGIAKPGMDNGNDRFAKDAIPAYTVPLPEVLERFETPPVIDYLSLDVEGAEYSIMQGFPLDSYRIRVLTVERPSEELKQLFSSHGYEDLGDISHFGETLWVHQDFKSSLDLSVVEEAKKEAIATGEMLAARRAARRAAKKA